MSSMCSVCNNEIRKKYEKRATPSGVGRYNDYILEYFIIL